MQGTREDENYSRTVYIGINKTGKSSRMLEVLQDTNTYDLSVHTCLIICETTPKAYEGLRRLKTYDDLRNFVSGIALFWDYDVDEETMLYNIIDIVNEGEQNGLKYLQNGAMVFEDASNYLDHSPPRAIKKFLGNHRMYHLDLFFTVHSFYDVPAFIRRRIKFVRIFKTDDVISPAALDKLKYRNAENIYRAWVDVSNSTNFFENITLKTGQ